MPPDQLLVLLKAAQRELLTRQYRNKLASYRPYAKQREFHSAGRIYDERLFMAGNQLGKTLAGGFEWATHLTGRYPDDWEGHVFDHPVKFWAAGVTGLSTRDNPQRMLIGPPMRKEAWGTGAIPYECIKDTITGRGVPNGLDSAIIKWGGGGDVQAQESVLSFKAYEQGREKWQGDTLDGVWCDEEPPLELYSEGKTRVQATNGIIIVTFTPLKGMSDVVNLFLTDSDIEALQKMAA
jgi:phage terminase large subunit-like protein